MHCHLMVSRKDQTNNKKLSPLTNHKNTKSGIIKGGFDRVNLFQKIEQGFNKLFNYQRQQTDSFDFHNMMKNSSIYEQLKLQEQGIQSGERKIEIKQDSNQENLFSVNIENKEAGNQAFWTESLITTEHKSNVLKKTSFDQENNQTSNSFISFASSEANFFTNPEEKVVKPKKRKKGRRL